MDSDRKVLLAGATGYLGSYILAELINRNCFVKTVVRNTDKLPKGISDLPLLQVKTAEVTKPETLTDICDNIDTVISTIGITKQRDGLTYQDVDYQANLNLLNEAKKAGVRKFIYVAVLNGEQFSDLKICQAKEAFVKELMASGLEYCIVRPNGFFSDMTEVFKMAQRGKVYVFGNGEQKANPIHGADLSKACVDQIESTDKELEIGGPETFTHNEIAHLAFKAVGKKPRITHVPDWARKLSLKLSKLVMSKSQFGPIEFFLNVMAVDMVAPAYGTQTLEAFFEDLNKQ
ncbi:SDR family oxidoreductase [Roseivirga pacifica]|uniref:SDR family oxidoreductase n=1 Tax=Roseivirga pacifica TaxID=1267423 RepID=UPI0020957DF3|nr:SDR family oxidoreductase [Roseivirga pacifica]MCO6360859.1 NAD(P)H-binding protein [Roseivirga pacifica]MCO6368748.1 NAD(P)H-binding protein [Roseivirga pacifica]MCO6372891.1 NAD(P)H-binding protein [Roseivirga pacifica]MCO6376950.1 NAD(P)H-binding protein [Roseivirga pacifica]MCO6377772.1 NAD(P)H-binding protein [Roseivirga pacifica]